jgi:hypothetical protein
MIKKILFSALLALIFIIPVKADSANEDFSQMNPTVRVTSYKKLFIDQVLAYGSGSGTVVTSDGILITNHHVIFDDDKFEPLDAFEVCITFDVQKEPVCKYTARLIAEDKDLDIALLKINNTDVFGKSISGLKYMNYKTSATPKEQTQINVVGYPASGGDTITISKGQISGFEKFNGYNYFKTDTDFDHGSSGGTAIDPDGNYIGIPTYIRSYAENVGYFLDIREATKWIDANIGKTPQKDEKSEQLLTAELARLSKANDSLTYTQESYPYIQSTLPDGWKFYEINADSFYASQKNLSTPVGLSAQVSYYQFEIDQSYMNKLDDDLASMKESYPDYKKEVVQFAGQTAWKVSYTSMSSQNITYYIPYGYAMVTLSYSIDLNESADQEKAIKPVLDSFIFTKDLVKIPTLTDTIKFDDPPFEITAFNDFRIQKNNDKNSDTLLAEAVQKENFEGSFAIYYDQVPKDSINLTAKERLDDTVKNLGGKKLVYKNDNVTLGGLNGFLYTYEYEGSKFQEKRKAINILLRNSDYEFTIVYDDKTESFDKNLPTIQKMLDSFSFKGGTSSGAKNSYGNLGSTFNDIQFHRFAQAISNLADKGIVKGYSDGGFHPEDMVSRGEALKIILESKNYIETKKESKKIVDFSQFENVSSSFKDVGAKNPFLKYVQYAYDKKFISGYSNGNFKSDQSVTLTEALKLIINTYEVPVWAGNTNPWYKKYMDKGFELGIIPEGLYDPSHTLTRGELAYLVNNILGQADDSGFGY